VFDLDQLDPDDTLSLWALSARATTDGTVRIRPRELKGTLTLTVAPKYAARICGTAVDGNGKPIAGAKVTLSSNGPYATDNANMKGRWPNIDSQATREDGRFDFRALLPGMTYALVIEARGHEKTRTPELIGHAGETHDCGMVLLLKSRD
jgi:protocatechuate 3,4-dioxygenase beta subunit